MNVLLKVIYTQEYDVIICVESIKEAMQVFDPCEDLEECVPIYGNCNIDSAIEIITCPECNGKGYHYIKNPDGTENSKNCKTCHRDGYIKGKL